jgi:hypothetical protein
MQMIASDKDFEWGSPANLSSIIICPTHLTHSQYSPFEVLILHMIRTCHLEGILKICKVSQKLWGQLYSANTKEKLGQVFLSVGWNPKTSAFQK